MLTSENVSNLLKSLCDAKLEIQAVNKSGLSKAFNKEGAKYATIDDVLEATTTILAKHGLLIFQDPKVADGYLFLTTRLYHVSDQWIQNNISCRLASEGAQSVGSGLTYLRRYTIVSMLGLQCGEDDDGNAASATSEKKKPWENKPVIASPNLSRNLMISNLVKKNAALLSLDIENVDRPLCREVVKEVQASSFQTEEDLNDHMNALFEEKLSKKINEENAPLH